MQQIVFMIGQLGYGGSEKQLYSVLKHIDRSRFTVQVWVVLAGGMWERRIRELGIEIVDLDKCPKLFRPFAVYVLARRGKIDIWWSWSYFTNLYAHFIPKNVVRMGSLRSALSFARRGVGRLYPLYENSLDLLVCNSGSVLRDLTKSGYHGLTTWIGNIVESVVFSGNQSLEFREDAGCKGNDILIIGVGSLVKSKNYTALLKAICALPERVRLTVIGDGLERSALEKECMELSIFHRVWMPGNLLNAAGIISCADLFVHPSISEGMPNVILEAAVAGVPIVATDVDGVREILSADDAMIVPVNDVNALVSAIQYSINNYSEIKNRALRLQEVVRAKFAPAYVVSKMEAWIAYLSGAGPRPTEFGSDL